MSAVFAAFANKLPILLTTRSVLLRVGNNIDILPITRSTASASNSDVVIEGEEPIEIPDYTIEYFEPIIKIYTITGALLDITDTEYLSHGIYIIQYIFPDRVVSEKIFK